MYRVYYWLYIMILEYIIMYLLDRDFEGSIEINKNHTNDLLLPI